MLSSDHDWLQSSFPLSSPLLPSLPFFFPLLSCPAISLCFRRKEPGRGRGKGEFPQPRAKDQIGGGTGLLTWTLLLDPWEASFTQEYSVHSCQNSASEQHNYQYSTTPAKTSQWCFFPFLLPSFRSQAKWNNNNISQTLAECVIMCKYHHPANEILLLSEPADPTLL